MILHMSLNMLGPILLVLGGPVTLALRVSAAHRPDEPAGLHEWVNALLAWPFVRHLYNPILVWVTFVGSYWLLYFTTSSTSRCAITGRTSCWISISSSSATFSTAS